MILASGRLYQQYCCDMWAQIQGERLNYQVKNQKTMRGDQFK
jgi:hypothetical protein